MVFTASFKEPNESTKHYFDNIFQSFNEIIDHMDKCLMEQDSSSVEMKEDLSRDCQSEALLGQQARPEGEEAHNEESG